ncbi:MAG TPA: hypothetical protein VFZ65_10550 [Planctomycetota bacterium]|nr:hypothetical protein [Planctomycetota bacterium]
MRGPLCADVDAFSLHAAVRVEARDRDGLEYLCPVRWSAGDRRGLASPLGLE